MSTLRDYRSPPWETSLYKGIPMDKYTPAKLDVIREIVGHPIRIKFRGPRPANSGRSAVARQGTCLKSNAKTFTVYAR